MGAQMPEHTEFLNAMARLYDRVDKAVARLGLSCEQCGTCCNFSISGVVLCASSPEVKYLEALFPKAAERRLVANACSLREDGQCTVYSARPLGCRTYFCRRRKHLQLEAIYEAFYRELRSTAAEYGIPWEYDRFLLE